MGLGAALAVVVAVLLSDLLLQPTYLLYDRPRPEEVLGGEVGCAVAARALWAYVAAVA